MMRECTLCGSEVDSPGQKLCAECAAERSSGRPLPVFFILGLLLLLGLAFAFYYRSTSHTAPLADTATVATPEQESEKAESDKTIVKKRPAPVVEKAAPDTASPAPVADKTLPTEKTVEPPPPVEAQPAPKAATADDACGTGAGRYPCQFSNVIGKGDWSKIRSALMFMSINPTLENTSWKHGEVTGTVKRLSSEGDCTQYVVTRSPQLQETDAPVSVCQTLDGLELR